MDAAEIQFDAIRRDVSGRQRFINLLRKELGESRGVELVGVCAFAIMPMFWGLVYIAIDDQRNPAMPFALVLALLAGWLYAMVLGAHMVCRDWGRAEEYFLLARPVSPRMAVGAKLLAGLILLGLIFISVALADMLTFVIPAAMFGPSDAHYREMVAIPVLALGLMIGSYLLAFAAAVVTRQMLTSMLLAILILCVWFAAPLIWQPLKFLHPTPSEAMIDGNSEEAKLLLANLPFFGAVLACLFSAVTTAFIAATWERTFRLGHKTLAWVFAVVILALLAAALTEVGNSLTVLDAQAMNDTKMQYPYPPSEWQFVSDGDRVLGLSALDNREQPPDKQYYIAHKRLVTFRVTTQGKIQDLRVAELWYSSNPNKEVLAGKKNFYYTDSLSMYLQYLCNASVDDAGNWVISGKSWRKSQSDFFQMRLSWPPGKDPRVTSVQRTVLPPTKGGSELHRVLLRFTSTDHRAYAEYAEHSNEGLVANVYAWPKIMYVFDWSDQQCLDQNIFDWTDPQCLDQNIGPSRAINEDSPEYQAWIQSDGNGDHITALKWHGVTHFWQPRPENRDKHATKYPTPAGYGPTFPPVADVTSESQAGFDREITESRIGESDWNKVVWDRRRELMFVSNGQGLQVFQPEQSELKLLGQCVASPLSRMFRGYINDLTLLDDRRVVELTLNTLILYDVADPVHPRRIGFFNLRGYSAQAFEVGGRLVLRQLPRVTAGSQVDQLLILDKPGGN